MYRRELHCGRTEQRQKSASAHGISIMSRLQLHLSAKNLKNVGGLMSMSDPFAVVTVRGDSANNKPAVVGQTDVYVIVSYRCVCLSFTRTCLCDVCVCQVRFIVWSRNDFAAHYLSLIHVCLVRRKILSLRQHSSHPLSVFVLSLGVAWCIIYHIHLCLFLAHHGMVPYIHHVYLCIYHIHLCSSLAYYDGIRVYLSHSSLLISCLS